MLRIADLEVAYGHYQVLWGVSLEVKAGEIVCLLGPNGAGKSTVMNSVTGLVRARAGSLEFQGEEITRLPTHQIVRRGLAHVLERRRLFPYLTVHQNLILGSLTGEARLRREETLGEILGLFPPLRDRLWQSAYSLSGGEQQMVAIARGLMARPKFLMIDEPFLGLAPIFQTVIIETIQKIRDRGITVLFIEQHVQDALSISSRGYILERGRVALTGTGAELLASEDVRKVYMGM
ncbi:MAG TPA: ABC transporter ATP-binding protein [Candidatus Methylomirabilis sp.]|nr:ABC transporter ATP-binding protein [Candidatus Methylomirabilis sp.]